MPSLSPGTAEPLEKIIGSRAGGYELHGQNTYEHISGSENNGSKYNLSSVGFNDIFDF